MHSKRVAMLDSISLANNTRIAGLIPKAFPDFTVFLLPYIPCYAALVVFIAL